MSGGRLVVLDRQGRDVKRFPLPEGLATLGSDPACDIRVMLPSVSAHHATVVVHANQTVVRNVSDGETLVNGQSVSVVALHHEDIISIGGRSLRWEYTDPTNKRQPRGGPEPAALSAWRRGRGQGRGRGRGRGARRSTGGGGGAGGSLARSPAVRLALEMTHRASMPGSAGGKQVAIVQPQRRDTNDQNDKNPPRTPLQTNKRRSKNDLDTSTNESEAESSKRKSTARVSPKNVSNLQTTKATMWIESRKTSPRKTARVQTPSQVLASVRRSLPTARKSTPLRLTVLKRAQSAQKMKVTKIEAPLKIDHTKQAAIMLMTGHTPKSRVPSPKSAKRTPSYVVKKPSPVRKTPASGGRKSTRRSTANATPASIGVTPKRTSTYSDTRRSSRRADHTVSILEITDSETQNSTARASATSRRSSKRSPKKSPLLSNPKKSALKDPKAKKSVRKTESIKFDLSNLEHHSQSADVLMVTDTTKQSYDDDSASEDDITLRYSDTTSALSPSPRRSIHSRSSKILERTLGTTVDISAPSRTPPAVSPRSVKSQRGSIILQNALDKTETYSRRSTRSLLDHSEKTANGSAFQTRTLSPRSSRNDLESYSIVDLVSIDSNESGRSTSVYNSVGSTDSASFGTPQNSASRKTRSTIDPTLLGSSTPYVIPRRSLTRSQSSLNTSNGTSNDVSQLTAVSSTSRRSKSLSTPENSEDTKKQITVNSTKLSRASKSRSRLNDSDLLLVEGDDDDSPRSSKRSRTKSNQTSPTRNSRKNETYIASPAETNGTITPENRHSPEEASTPVLSIQSLLDSSQSSFTSYNSEKKGRLPGRSFVSKRKTIGVISEPRTRAGVKSKSMSFTARKTRLRLSSDSVQDFDKDNSQNEEEIVTPKSAVKLVQEGVKNKHSSAKKPQSKRSLIDDLNESDIVKQLFNSPVKRKLSQSMTEFSRKHLFDDDDVVFVKRPTRNTIALMGRTPDSSLLDHSPSYTPERFVSPINTPRSSPDLTGIKRLFGKNTPDNDLRNVRGVNALLRTPRVRRSVRNDLSNVGGVKELFADGPRDRLSDVTVKEVFAASPKNDLRRVSGVKSLFQSEKKSKPPKNDLSDVRGVKKLFKGNKSPANDLRNVSGVKRAMQKGSPRNNLDDVRGVKRMFTHDAREQSNGLNDISGVEELFNESEQSYSDSDKLFDRLLGRPPIRAVYSKTFSTRLAPKTKRNRKSLHSSLDLITNNVEQWLEQELQKHLHKKDKPSAPQSADRSKNNLTRELQKLATNTVEGTTPIRNSRVRTSTLIRSIQADAAERKKSASELYSAHTLPIKKRSLVDTSSGKTGENKSILPIKKRVVIHSTPVKGRANMTMNASELGRVSPIAAVDKTSAGEHDTSLRSSQQLVEPSEVYKPKGRRQTNAKNLTQVPSTSKAETVTPKKTRAKSKLKSPKNVKPSPAKSRSTRQTKAKVANNTKSISSQETKVVRQTKGKVANNTKSISSQETKVVRQTKGKVANNTKSISSQETKVVRQTKGKVANNTKSISSQETKVVSPIAKKVPAKTKASPKAKTPSPTKTRTTRSRKNAATPDVGVKKRGATVVVPKKTPVMTPKPRATRKQKDISTPKASPKSTRNRKNDKAEDKVKTPKNTRTRVQKASVVVSKPSPQLKPRAARRGQVDPPKQKELEKPGNSKGSRNESQKANISDKDIPKTRSRRTVVQKQESTQSEPVKRGRKANESKNATTRNADKEKSVVKANPRSKKSEAQASVQSEPTTRSRRTRPEEAPEVKTRKRKIVSEDAVPIKVVKSKDVVERKGRKRTIETTETETATGRQKRSVVKDSKVEITRQGRGDEASQVTRVVRCRRVLEVTAVTGPQQKRTRGRQTTDIEEVAPAVGKRKRKNTVDPSPVKEPSKKQPAGKKSRKTVEPSSPVKTTRTRSTRAKNIEPEVSNKTAGRGRRR